MKLRIRDESASELSAAFSEHGYGLSDAQMTTKSEPLESLEVAPKAFQFRDGDDRPWEKERHVRNLVRAIERLQEPLDPLLLFAVAGRRIVIDGHCRLRAYLRAGFRGADCVPVVYFRGSFSEALTRPASLNSKENLPLTHGERLEAAWRLVLFDESRGEYSARAIGRWTGAGKSTVCNMRKALSGASELGFDPRTRSWREVKTQRQEQREVNENWEEERSQRWCYLIRRQLGDKPNQTPQCLFEALEKAYPQVFPHGIPVHWAEDAGIIDEYLNHELDDFRF